MKYYLNAELRLRCKTTHLDPFKATDLKGRLF